MEEPPTVDDDVSIGTSILMQLRAVLVVMSHRIMEKNLSLTLATYLAATCYSLRLLDHEILTIIEALFKILSLVIPKVSAAKLMDEIELVSQSLVHVLRWSDSLTESSNLSGIKCVSHLHITIRNRIDDWSDNSAAAFSGLYGCLMAFVTHYPFQVRLQLWSCLCDVLRSFQGTMLIEPASEAITALFKKWFPCGEPIAVGSQGRIVAFPGMFVLDTLEECLFLMSTKYKLAILNDFKILLELRHAVTTVRINYGLFA